MMDTERKTQQQKLKEELHMKNREALLKMTTEELTGFMDLDIERCLTVLKERKTRLNLNRAAKGLVKTTVTRNGANEESMLNQLAEILSGFINKEKDKEFEVTTDKVKKVQIIKYHYKEYIIEATINNKQIVREIIEAEKEAA